MVMLPVQRWAGSDVGKYNAKSAKQDSEKFNFITKTIHFAHLDILFIYGWGYRRRINIEEKWKVVAAARGSEMILDSLPQKLFCTRMI